jgi:hypothetical protein
MTDLGLIKSFLTPPLWRRNSRVKIQVFLGMAKFNSPHIEAIDLSSVENMLKSMGI